MSRLRIRKPGEVCGPWVVIRPVPKDEWRTSSAEWLVSCDTGAEHRLRSPTLNKVNLKTCSLCARHGHEHTKGSAYASWEAMRTRCNNPNHVRYANYGGRGIKIDKRWDAFVNFLRDMGERPDGMSLDRIDNDKGYSKSNCRWATPAQQCRNTAAVRLTQEIVDEIRRNALAGASHREQSRKLGISDTRIGCIVRGQAWKSA